MSTILLYLYGEKKLLFGRMKSIVFCLCCFNCIFCHIILSTCHTHTHLLNTLHLSCLQPNNPVTTFQTCVTY
ncbi:hypothetical protein Hdeb2414_s0015g00447281 [Helianthus debilis subsp. tardiflorus]